MFVLCGNALFNILPGYLLVLLYFFHGIHHVLRLSSSNVPLLGWVILYHIFILFFHDYASYVRFDRSNGLQLCCFLLQLEKLKEISLETLLLKTRAERVLLTWDDVKT
jgi:hypothetical protein